MPRPDVLMAEKSSLYPFVLDDGSCDCPSQSVELILTFESITVSPFSFLHCVPKKHVTTFSMIS